MSSTSSSDCENCDYCQCGRSLDNNYSFDCYGRPVLSSRHVPFCAAMGHPLIYYAEVSRHNRGQKSRKENKNCFVKAFEWYTQERIPASPKTCPAAERCGFANWLDSKYIEYLHDSRMEQHVYQLTTQPTTTIEPCEPCPSNEPCATTTTKRFARMKSPWRKRRRSCKDAGDVPEKCGNQSCEFIMQPKDLTRAASDCCYPTPNSGCNKSNATVVSSSGPGTRGTGKSFSMTSVCRETTQNPIDIIPCTVQEGSKTKPVPPPPSDKKACCECKEQIQQVPSKPMKSKKTDVSCQCPEEKVVPVDVQTQYECLCVRYVKAERDAGRDVKELASCCKCVEGYAPAPVKTRSGKLSKSDLKPKFVTSTENIKSKKAKQSSVSCQCPEETVVTVDTPSQYQPEVVQCECTCAPRKISAPNVYAPSAQAPNICAASGGAANVCGSNVCAPNILTPSGGAANVSGPTVCGSNVCTPNIRTPSVNAINVYAPSVNATNVCAPTVCASNVCAPSVCNPNVCASNVCNPSVCALKVCAPNVCPPNVCVPNVGTPVREMKEQMFSGATTVRRQSYTTVTVGERDVDACGCYAPAPPLARDVTVTKYTRSLTLFANDAAQTSDHSICFEHDGVNQYPFFMKIVCADRLNNVCF